MCRNFFALPQAHISTMVQSMPPNAPSVLLLDDDQDFLSILAREVAACGFNVHTISDPTQAVAEIERLSDDLVLIISDYQMPQLNGLDVRAAINARHREIPFAILTGQSTHEMALRAVDLSICAFLSKPPQTAELKSLLGDKIKHRVDAVSEKQVLEESFVAEATELMEELEPLLLQIEEHPDDPEVLTRIFRIVHTIKGASGVLGRKEFTNFVHVYEDLLAKLKNGSVRLTPQLVSALLKGFDGVGRMLHAVRAKAKELPNLNDIEGLLKSDVKPSDGPGPDASVKGSDGDRASVQEAKKEVIAVPKAMLDEFLHLTGETTVMRNMVNKLVKSIERRIPRDRDVELLVELLEEMHKINATMQNRISELRKTPMTQVLKRLPRTVRDVAMSLGKKVKFNVVGEDLRVDTAIAQALSNSLTHMIRNSVDHGIESPRERQEHGKPSEGRLTLSCEENKDQVIVIVEDDGKGIDPQRIKAKLLENGQIESSVVNAMSRDELLKQIFAPGFSTAKEITDVSGRGVGMDMVRASIEALRGTIDVHSEVGKGTRFRFVIPVPKSVVIINSLVVAVAGQGFALPQDNIVRLLRLSTSRRQRDVRELAGVFTLNVDGKLLPLVCLGKILGIKPRCTMAGGDDQELSVVIVRCDSGEMAVVVDEIHDAEDTVVKPLYGWIKSIGAYAGATFFGDGSVGLIIDAEGIAKAAGISAASKQDLTAPNNAEIGERCEYILFRAEGPEILALQLTSVFRLEEVKRTEFHQVGSKWVMSYRGSMLPVLDVAGGVLIGNKSDPDKLADNLQTLVLRAGNNLVAAPIKEIIEICSGPVTLLPALGLDDAIKGVMTAGDRVISVLSLETVLARAGLAAVLAVVPQVEETRGHDLSATMTARDKATTATPSPKEGAAAKQVTEPVEAESMTQSPSNELDQAAGWGLF